jgi:hypothetical protein
LAAVLGNIRVINTMRFRTSSRFPQTCATAILVVTLGGALSVFGGEAIQFSNPKGKLAPDSGSKISDTKLSDSKRLSVVNPFDSIGSEGQGRQSLRRDPKEEKRLKNARLERENWAVLDEGELQAQDDEETSLGGRGFGGDKDDPTKGDIWFGKKQMPGAPAFGASRSENSFGRRPGQIQPSDRKVDQTRFDFGSSSGRGNNSDLKVFTGSEPGGSPLKELFRPLPNALGSDGSRMRTQVELPAGRGLGQSIEGSRSGLSGPSPLPPRNLPSPYSSPLSLRAGSDSSGFGLTPPRNPTPPLNNSIQDPNRGSTRDLFAPPPRPGGIR